MLKFKIDFFRRVSPAFTIVELLVVIVVIGILAAITIVSYTGITSRATAASLQSGLTNASQQLKVYYTLYGSYPTIDSNTLCPTAPIVDNNYCLKASPGETYVYQADNSTNPQTFYITATKDSQSYTVMPSGVPLKGSNLDYGLLLNLDAGNSISYPGSGTTWTDLSGNGNNGTLINGVGYSGANGGALSFDGVSGYVNVGNMSTNFTGGITISSWAYPTSTNNWARFADFGNGTQNDNIVFARNGTSNNIYYEVKNGTANGTAVQASVVELNKWQYFSVSEDNQGNVSLYKNGSLVAVGSTNIPNNITRISNFIGRSNWMADSYYTGSVSDFTIYNRKLLQTEIQQNFNSLKGRYGL